MDDAKNDFNSMTDRNQKIIESKERLAAEVLVVAEDALQDIKVCMGDAGVKDLISIFNSAIKCHHDLMSDIVSLQDKESKEEKELAKEYTGKVDELLKKISGNQ